MRRRVSLATLLALSAGAALFLWFQPGQTNLQPQGPAPIEATQIPPALDFPVHLDDRAAAAGIHFQHRAGHTAMHYVPEIMGGGAAWLDYDKDGYMDLFLVQGGSFPPTNEMPSGPTSRLFRNQGDGTFVDVTEQVGLLHPGYGQGVAIGDYDNDGYPDLFLACYGHCHLFHNEADGHGSRRFREVTRQAGVELDGWCTSCAFGDVHGHGFLDLFVCRYVKMDLNHYPECIDGTVQPPQRFACGPVEFRGNSSVLFRNNGNGTFTNVSRDAGIEPDGKALGVMILDLDGDGKSDIFVGNDEVPNFYYRNLGGGRLESCGVLSGTATNYLGNAMGSMGVNADDVSGSGRPDVLVTTYYHEATALFRNRGRNQFTDSSQTSGMYNATWGKVGWGTCFLDVDSDGVLDLFVANGHVFHSTKVKNTKSDDDQPHSVYGGQLAQLFRGNGMGSFQEISRCAGAYFDVPHMGRGVAMGDYDNDGAMDIAINNCDEPAALLHNETLTPHHWIRLELEGSRQRNPLGCNRDAIGACVTVKIGERSLVRHVKGGTSYLSSPDRRLLIGLGDATRIDDVAVRWPNAAANVQHFGALATDHSYKLIEGARAAEPALCPPLKKQP